MSEPKNWLVHGHSDFEQLLHESMAAVEKWDWQQAKDLFHELSSQIEKHMAMEDEVLYPAYESFADLPQEPIRALKDEHEKINQLVGDVETVLDTNDSEHVLESMTRFEGILLDHHEKEESIFLPMAGHFLEPLKETLLERMREFDDSAEEKGKQ
jgi:iron-sulfur cluster repair protein YtfE (RIC family)